MKSALMLMLAASLSTAIAATSASERFATRFEQEFAIAVLDEDSRQREFKAPEGVSFNAGPYTLPPPYSSDRRARSEVLLIWNQDGGWLTRRRMVAANANDAAARSKSFEALAGKGVAALMSAAASLPSPTSLLQAGGIFPVLDYPIWPIAILDSSERARSGLADLSVEASSNQVRFVGRKGDAHIDGAIVMDSAGRIERAELTARRPTATVLIKSEFLVDKNLGLAIPKGVSERYESGFEVVSTEIAYSHLRRFEKAGSMIATR